MRPLPRAAGASVIGAGERNGGKPGYAFTPDIVKRECVCWRERRHGLWQDDPCAMRVLCTVAHWQEGRLRVGAGGRGEPCAAVVIRHPGGFRAPAPELPTVRHGAGTLWRGARVRPPHPTVGDDRQDTFVTCIVTSSMATQTADTVEAGTAAVIQSLAGTGDPPGRGAMHGP